MNHCAVTKLRTYDCGHLSGKNGWFCDQVVSFTVDAHGGPGEEIICHKPATRVNGKNNICERCVGDCIKSGDCSYDEAMKEFPLRDQR